MLLPSSVLQDSIPLAGAPGYPRAFSLNSGFAPPPAADGSTRNVLRFSDASGTDGPEAAWGSLSGRLPSTDGVGQSEDSNGAVAAAGGGSGFGSVISGELPEPLHAGSSGRSRKRSLASDMAAASQRSGSQRQQQQQQHGNEETGNGMELPAAKYSRANGSGSSRGFGRVGGGGGGAGVLPDISEEAADEL